MYGKSLRSVWSLTHRFTGLYHNNTLRKHVTEKKFSRPYVQPTKLLKWESLCPTLHKLNENLEFLRLLFEALIL